MKKTDHVAPKILFRSETNRLLAGVSSGLGLYFNLDSNLIRLIFVFLNIWSGAGLILYFTLWLLLPSESQTSGTTQDHFHQNLTEVKTKAASVMSDLQQSSAQPPRRNFLGILLLGLGIIFLLANFGLVRYLRFDVFWPVVLVVIGLALLFKD